jgi:hypothetical protein
VLTNQLKKALTRRSRVPDDATADLSGLLPFPVPMAVISLRRGTTFRAVDRDGQPVLIITDGVNSVALESGTSGLSYGVVAATRRLAESVTDFATSIGSAWEPRAGADDGRHRRDRRNPVVRDEAGRRRRLSLWRNASARHPSSRRVMAGQIW